MTHTNQPTDAQLAFKATGLPSTTEIDQIAIFRAQLAKIVDGAPQVVGPPFLDWLAGAHPDVACVVRTVPNPERVGLLDRYLTSTADGREPLDTIFVATQAAQKVADAKTYTDAWMLYRIAHRRCTIRTGQDILMRAISRRVDHPMRRSP